MIAQILTHAGEAGNVAQAGNCMTRLRLTLCDEQLADSAAIRQIAGVMGVIVSDEQFQIVLGPGKAQTAAEMMNSMLNIPGFLRIGEPLIYDVTLPLMKPFVTACIGGACGGSSWV